MSLIKSEKFNFNFKNWLKKRLIYQLNLDKLSLKMIFLWSEALEELSREILFTWDIFQPGTHEIKPFKRIKRNYDD